MIGETLAHYQITQKIGAGGMGDVYRATDSKLHREVAIKVISPAYAKDPERMARFEREAHVLASLTHGSIAAVYGLEEANGSKALVMELVEGEDLSERLRRGPMPLDEVLRTGVQIAEALESAHEQGIIHRDLKPANVRLLPDGHVKLLDFGLAKALEDAGPPHLTGGDTATLSLAATRAGIILGTAAYMSPEQATGGVVDRRTDVWSFGVVLFEMLTGRRLFEGETTSHTLAEVIRADIDFARLPADTPGRVRELLERCLERDKRKRLRDIGEARIALEAQIERLAATRSQVSVGAAPVARTGSRWRAMWPAAAGVVGGAALAAAALGIWLPSGATSRSGQLRFDVKVGSEPIFSDLGPGVALSPDGSHLAFLTGNDSNRRMQLRRLDQLDSATLITGSSTDAAPYHPFFSPDGAWVGYVTPTELRKIPVAGGTPLIICQVNRSRGATWAPDGTIVLAPTTNSGLSRVSAAGGPLTPVTTLAEGEASHRWPQVLPDGKRVMFTSHGRSVGGFDEAKIEVVDLDTGTRKVVFTGGAMGQYVPTGHLVYVNRGTLFAVPFDLGTLDVRGTPAPVVQNVTASSSEGAVQVAFSNDGTLAYLRGGALVPEYPIVWVDRNGSVSPLLDEPGAYASPRLSPDGSRLSLTVFRDGNWDIWVYDIDRHVMTRLTFDEGIDTEQIWSPDGRELIFGSSRGARPTALYRKPADGSGEERLVVETGFDVWPTTWSPDGRFIGASANRDSFDVALISLTDPSDLQWVTTPTFAEIDPAISPDGRWVAYSSTESGMQQIYVRPFSAGSGRWQISDSGGGYARWSRDGRELFYRSDEGVMSAVIETVGASLRTGKPRLLFKGNFRGGSQGLGIASNVFADYDVSADGQRFVMFPQAGSTGADRVGLVTFVSGWFDELERLTPGN